MPSEDSCEVEIDPVPDHTPGQGAMSAIQRQTFAAQANHTMAVACHTDVDLARLLLAPPRRAIAPEWLR